jgi:hypothetical protein
MIYSQCHKLKQVRSWSKGLAEFCNSSQLMQKIAKQNLCNANGSPSSCMINEWRGKKIVFQTKYRLTAETTSATHWQLSINT